MMNVDRSTVHPPLSAPSAGASSSQQRTGRLAVGTVVDEVYRITGVLGSGGFSTVYHATHVRLNREVAIKVLRPQFGDDDEDRAISLERFMREARTTAQLQHPNAVTVYDMGFVGKEMPYIAMEVFDGKSLGEALAEDGPMTLREAVPLFCDCLSALAEAHAHGIVHRDLKPDNLILTSNGLGRQTLKIIDFGVARLTSGSAALTQQNAFVGTLPYLPPEYIVDNVVDTRLDVYQMALTLVEALTGVPVVQGDNQFAMMHAITSGALDIPDAITTGPIGPVLALALAPHPQRYPDATAFLAALEAVDLDGAGADVRAAAPAPGAVEAQVTTLFAREDQSAATVTVTAEPTAAIVLPPIAQTPAARPSRAALLVLIALATMLIGLSTAFVAYLLTS